MNKRIKELAEQADEFANNWFPANTYNPDWQEIRDKKFAELIVRECIDIIHPYEDDDHYIEKDVRKYFGVEE